MTLSAWWLLALAIPLLALGELLVRRVKCLARFDLPASIVGGLLVALSVFAWNVVATWSDAAPVSATAPVTAPGTLPATAPSENASTIKWDTKTGARWLTWLVMAEPDWAKKVDTKTPGVQEYPKLDVFIPFSSLFFTCVGLCASWRIVRTGSWPLLIFLALAGGFAILQNVLGITLARSLGEHGALGVICGSVTLTGGISTAFANDGLFREYGFEHAKIVGAASTMFGIVTASLLAGAIGGALIRYRNLSEQVAVVPDGPIVSRPRRGFFDHVIALFRLPVSQVLLHLLILFVCIKVGAYLRLWIMDMEFIRRYRIGFPVYLPGLVFAVVLRNVLDAINPTLVKTEIVERIAGVALGIFLVAAISSLDLLALKSLAGPMLVILIAQLAFMVLFAVTVTFYVMGRDYHAAVISSGHIGFGMGMTTNAVATMDVLAAKFGPTPKSFLIVTLVGGFLVDVLNTLIIPASMPFVR